MGEMYTKQKLALVMCSIIVLLMFLFPPFHVEGQLATLNMGYRFILDPPMLDRQIVATVNVEMLLGQWIGTILNPWAYGQGICSVWQIALPSMGTDLPTAPVRGRLTPQTPLPSDYPVKSEG